MITPAKPLCVNLNIQNAVISDGMLTATATFDVLRGLGKIVMSCNIMGNVYKNYVQLRIEMNEINGFLIHLSIELPVGSSYTETQ